MNELEILKSIDEKLDRILIRMDADPLATLNLKLFTRLDLDEQKRRLKEELQRRVQERKR